MAQFARPKSPDSGYSNLWIDFAFLKNENLSMKTDNVCRCGSKTFLEMRQVTRTNGGTSLMYECTACGDLSI